MGLVGHPRSMSYANGRGAGGRTGGKTGSLSGRTRSLPPASIRARSLFSRPLDDPTYRRLVRPTYTTTTLSSRTVSLRITDAARSLPRTSSTRGSSQFRSWNRCCSTARSCLRRFQRLAKLSCITSSFLISPRF